MARRTPLDTPRPIRALLVDDDEDDFRLTQSLLREIPGDRFMVDWVSDFDAALEAICRGEHDVYLVDYRLGDRTGLDLLAAAHERSCPGPIILLTGQGQPEIDRAAEAAGAADYLEKSRLDPVELERSIRYALRKHAQESELERMVVERTAELEEANKALKDSDRRKDEFLATLGHELRNPLAPIRNALEIQRLVSGDTNAVEKARAVIERQVLQLVRLIDDLLDASRITRDKLRLVQERLDLREPLTVAVEMSQPLLEKAGLTFETDLPDKPLMLEGDRLRLAQIFTNLLNNSAKYTEAPGTVRLAAVADNGRVRVSIRDSGIGIPAEHLPRVFDLFTQVDRALNRSEGGLGIGLALAKRLVEMHGGELLAESPGSRLGATFTVVLPLAPRT